MKRPRNIQKVKEHDKNSPNQRGGYWKSTWKRIQNNDSKDDLNLENKMKLWINRLETKIEKIQTMLNKFLEEIKNSQSVMNNAIIQIKNTLEGIK